jgi:predicted GNAT family acetyltransferase
MDSVPVGRLYVSRKEREIRILDVTILPEYRGRGLGTPLIRDLMDEAARAGKSLSVYVETFNPSSNLFERLGFAKVSDDGVNYLMEWRPDSISGDG